MDRSFSCTPRTFYEQRALAQCSSLDRLFSPAFDGGLSSMSNACRISTLEAFPTVVSGEFDLDRPIAVALAAQVVQAHPEQAALLLASSVLSQQEEALPEKITNAAFDTLFGGGNLPGNISATTEIALRAVWQRQAMGAFRALTSGAATGPIRLGAHITIEPRNIGKGGQLRKGARMMVRVRGLPTTVVHSLPSPILSKAGGRFGAVRVGARDMQRMAATASALADARVRSVAALRFAGGKVGGGVLAFGPSAVIDLYDSARWTGTSLQMDWKGLAVRSAKSQSGNMVGFVAGAAAMAIIGTAGLPVLVVGLGVGLIAQVIWSSTGGDEWAAQAARKAVGR